jgi:hypothetical protein
MRAGAAAQAEAIVRQGVGGDGAAVPVAMMRAMLESDSSPSDVCDASMLAPIAFYSYFWTREGWGTEVKVLPAGKRLTPERVNGFAGNDRHKDRHAG